MTILDILEKVLRAMCSIKLPLTEYMVQKIMCNTEKNEKHLMKNLVRVCLCTFGFMTFVYSACAVNFFLVIIFSILSQWNLFFGEQFNYFEFLWGLIAVPSFVVGILIQKNKDEEKLEKIKTLKEIKQESGYFKNEKNVKRFEKIVNTYETLDEKVLVKKNVAKLLMSVFVVFESIFLLAVIINSFENKICLVAAGVALIFYAGYAGKIFAWNNVDFEYYCFYTALCELEEQLHIPVMNICRAVEAEKKCNVFGCIPNGQWKKTDNESPYGEEVLVESCENYDFVSSFLQKYGFNIKQKYGHYYILMVGEYRYYIYCNNEERYQCFGEDVRMDSKSFTRHHMKEKGRIFGYY